ncbi:MAG: glycosyltransferase [Vicinamibacterales bacterium]
MRILHVCGATRGAPWLCEIVREQAARGHDVSVVIAGSDGPLPRSLERAGVRYVVRRHDPFADANPIRAWRRIRGLATLMRAERPDVIQSHLFPSNVAGRIAGWLADVPIRLSMNAGPYVLESPILGEIDVRTSRADTRVIASCEYVRRLYAERGVPPGRIALAYYGSNPERFDPARAQPAAARRSLGVTDGTALVGLVAYFYPPAPDSPTTPPALVGRGLKGHDVLLRAIPRVLERRPDTTFVLVGEGWEERGRDYQEQMRALAGTLGVASSVIFAGYRADVPDLLAAFDVAVQCSLSENVGGAIEALMMGAPTVVSATGGLVDAVRHDDTGLVVPPDDPVALADAIVTLLADRPRARRLGDRGRALMLERFTAARTAEDLEALYVECASAPRFRGRPPRESGYRWTRRVARTVGAPIWAWRLARPALLALAGERSMSAPALAGFAARLALLRIRDVVAAVVVLTIASPCFVWHRVRHAGGPLFTDVVVTGRHGLPFALRTFTVAPAARWMRRLPWFITLLKTRQLALFGPAPSPYDSAARVARTDPRARRRPGVFDLRDEGRGLAPAPPRPRPPAARRS